MTDKVNFAKVYTDGGCWPNPGYGGSGMFITQGNESTLSWWSLPGNQQTNNTAEIEAMIRCLEMALERGLEKISIFPDSEYTINSMVKWRAGQEARNYMTAKGEPIQNKDLIIKMHEKYDALKATGCVIEVEWVKGHSNVLENEFADLGATRGRIAASKGLIVNETITQTTKKFMQKPSPKYHRLFSLDKWYFTEPEPIITKDGYHVYFCGYHGKPDTKERDGREDTSLGRALCDSYHAIVYTKKPNKELEAIRKAHFEMMDTTLGLVNVGVLNKIHTATAWEELTEYGDTYLTKDPKSGKYIQTSTKVPLSHIADPAKLSFDAIEVCRGLQSRLEFFLCEHSDVTATEITDLIYSTEVSKKGKESTIINPTINASVKSIGTTVKHWMGEDKVTLTFGLDIPVRNTLSALKDGNPKVYVLTWQEGLSAFRYCTVLKVDDGMLLMSNSYANYLFCGVNKK